MSPPDWDSLFCGLDRTARTSPTSENYMFFMPPMATRRSSFMTFCNSLWLPNVAHSQLLSFFKNIRQTELATYPPSDRKDL
jgi:hypothetical protein